VKRLESHPLRQFDFYVVYGGSLAGTDSGSSYPLLAYNLYGIV